MDGTLSPDLISDNLPTFTLIVPTIGRPSLARTLVSIRNQAWVYGDQVLLAADGPCPLARQLWNQFDLPGNFVESEKRLGYWGHGLRNEILDQRVATGDFLLAMDDDDLFVPDAVALIRQAIVNAPERPHIFRMQSVKGVLWDEPELRINNVGTPMLVFPNQPEKLGRYALRYGGDLDFAKQTAEFYPADALVWRPEIICIVRPDQFRLNGR